MKKLIVALAMMGVYGVAQAETAAVAVTFTGKVISSTCTADVPYAYVPFGDVAISQIGSAALAAPDASGYRTATFTGMTLANQQKFDVTITCDSTNTAGYSLAVSQNNNLGTGTSTNSMLNAATIAGGAENVYIAVASGAANHVLDLSKANDLVIADKRTTPVAGALHDVYNFNAYLLGDGTVAPTVGNFKATLTFDLQHD